MPHSWRYYACSSATLAFARLRCCVTVFLQVRFLLLHPVEARRCSQSSERKECLQLPYRCGFLRCKHIQLPLCCPSVEGCCLLLAYLFALCYNQIRGRSLLSSRLERVLDVVAGGAIARCAVLFRHIGIARAAGYFSVYFPESCVLSECREVSFPACLSLRPVLYCL